MSVGMNPDVQELYDQVAACLERDDEGALAAAVRDARAADIAEAFDLLEDVDRSRVLYSLPPRTLAEVVVLLDDAVRGEVVEEMTDETLSEIVTELAPDDAADFVADLDVEQSDEVLEHVPREHSDQITELLTYGPETAGGIMNPRLIALRSDETVGSAIAGLRKFAPEEDLHYVYIVDESKRLVGMVPLRRLVVRDSNTVLASIAEPDPITVRVDADQEEALRAIQKYDLAAVPVVDADGLLLGRITYDDVMDVASEEADEDIFRMAGTDAAELETHSPFRAARVRMAWLVPCIIGTLLAGGVIALFASSSLTKTQMAALTLFVPMIAATSGNAGIQASTIVLRGLATGELGASRIQYVFAREVRVAIFVGILCAALTGVGGSALLATMRSLEFQVAIPEDVRPTLMGVAIFFGMICAIAESVTLGITLPFAFKRFGVDPAIASGPLITSANDLLSVTIYLTSAMLILS